MIFLYLIGLIAYMFSWILSLLPNADFLALPVSAYSAVEEVASWLGWALGLMGPSVKATLLVIIPIVLGLEIATSLWYIIRHWDIPLVNRWVGNRND